MNGRWVNVLRGDVYFHREAAMKSDILQPDAEV